MTPPPVIQKLNCREITVSPELQPRIELDEDLIAKYRGEMLEGIEFDPIEVVSDGTTRWVTDGHHRLSAAIAAGFEQIPATVVRGDFQKALLHAARANARHGSPRKSGDKRRQVEMALATDDGAKWSDHEVARWCGVSHTLVGSIRKSSLATVASEKPQNRVFKTKHGTTATMKTANIGRTSSSSAGKRDEGVSLPPPRPAPVVSDPAPLDGAGRPIPDDPYLRRVFATRDEALELVAQITALKQQAGRLSGKPGFEAWNQKHYDGFGTVQQELRQWFMPHGICPNWPNCRVGGCKVCGNKGFITEGAWNIVAKDYGLKPVKSGT